MAITWNQAVARIADRAINRSFDDDTVNELAECFKTVRFKTPVDDPDEVGGAVTPYSVLGEDNFGNARVILRPDGGSMIPSAFVVPTVAAADMEPVEVRAFLIFKVLVPAFRAATIPPSKNTWKLLDLEDVALAATTPQVIITTQLTGCTFAIGSVGRKYYMGHTQPASSSTGVDHAEKLQGGPIFDGIILPGMPISTNLESKLFIRPGSKNDSDTDTLAYAPARQVNVLGFVVGGTKLSFIVQIVMPSPLEIEKVFVVTHASPSTEWTITPVL